ncbi:MAG TPA: hypothetical protein PLK37_08445, partial [Terricaulis sp.]|nr:hypothetical protein [Terricaulis sp.]
MGWALWAWLCACLLSGVLAAASGAERAALGQAIALMAAPALAGFILLPWLGRAPFADLGLVAAWVVAGAGLVAGGGGAQSPLAMLLVLGPAWALTLARPWTADAGGAMNVPARRASAATAALRSDSDMMVDPAARD